MYEFKIQLVQAFQVVVGYISYLQNGLEILVSGAYRKWALVLRNQSNNNNKKKPAEKNLWCTLDIHSITSHNARGCLVDVPSSFLSADLSHVLFFWKEGSTVGLPIIYSTTESNSTYRPFFTHHTIRQESHHPGSFGEKGHHLCLLCWSCWYCFIGQPVQEPPWAIKRQIKGFSLAHLSNPDSSIKCMPANYEISRSGIGIREVRQFGFCFSAVAFCNCVEWLLEQECI